MKRSPHPRAAAVVAVVGSALAVSGTAHAAPPDTPTITEPVPGAIVNPADVHMEATGFADPDGDAHECSEWEIRSVPSDELAWHAPCASDVPRTHVHLRDGSFVNSHAGRTELRFDAGYVLRVRFEDDAAEASAWAERAFETSPPGPPGVGGAVPWAARQPGYRVEVVAGGLQLPVNVALVPDPGGRPDDPFLYVTELYGRIKVMARDRTVTDYAHGLLNFNPTGDFPGSGEQGVTGIAIDPASGDVFASMLYEDASSPLDPKPHYAKVVRFQSEDGGRTATSQTTVLDMPGEPHRESHQISNLTIGPDGMLYVHVGDGFDATTAQDLGFFRGKILRMTLDGSPPSSNPLYDPAPPDTASDYVYAYGLRNPFGGARRASDGAHYEVENGPSVDRFARIVPGTNYGWDGSDASMRNLALYNWDPAHAPTNIAFVEPETASGSGFPADKMDHAFVAESGPTYATGPQERGKRIVELAPEAGGRFADPVPFVEYTGTGKATASGLAAGPDGLYFTDLYRDRGYTSPIDPGAQLLRARYVRATGASPPETTIARAPRRKVRTKKKRAKGKFRFTSTKPASTFECKLGTRRFRACSSPISFKVKAGRGRFKKHTFRVRAKVSGVADPTPATHRWKAKRKPRRRR